MTKPRKQLPPADGPQDGQTAMQLEVGGYMALIREAASNPDIDVNKLKELMAMAEHMQANRARMSWNAAMNQAQEEMRRVRANRTNPQTHSRYPTYDQLDKALRPIYTRHGFSLSGNTGKGDLQEPVPADHVRVWLMVKHVDGHTEPFHVDMPADGKGAKGGDVMTKTHATGSAMSYGMRYLLKFAFNVAVGEDDDDGNAASRYEEVEKKGEERTVRARSDAAPKQEAKAEPDDTEYTTVKKARDQKTVITDSAFKTITAAMKKNKIPEGHFKKRFGFELAQLDKTGLSQTVDWIQAGGRV